MHFNKINFSLNEIYNYCKKNSKIHKNINYQKIPIGQRLWAEAKK